MASLFYYGYHGGKRTEIKHFKKLLDDIEYKTFVEPFCGSCAVSLYNKIKNKKDIKYHVNDLDKMHIDLLTDIKKDGCKKYYDFCRDNFKLGETTEPEFKKIIKDKDNLNNYFFWKRMYNIRIGLYPNRPINLDHTKYTETDNFFKEAEITNKDYHLILEQYKDDPDALLFLDPPYMNSSNVHYDVIANEKITDENYKIKDKTTIWIDIYNYMKTCKCKVILIINKLDILEYLFKEFKYFEYGKQYSNKMGGLSKNDKTHSHKTDHIIYTNIKI